MDNCLPPSATSPMRRFNAVSVFGWRSCASSTNSAMGFLARRKQLLQVSLPPFGLARYLDRLLRGSVRRTGRPPCQWTAERDPLAFEVGPRPARQDGLARADDGGQRDESSAHDRARMSRATWA
jgi:hypothetical protein